MKPICLSLLLLLAGCAVNHQPTVILTDAQADEDAATVVRLKAQVQQNALPQSAPLPPPNPNEHIIECTIFPADGHNVFLQTFAGSWLTVSNIDYPVEGDVVDFTNISTNLQMHYRVGVN